ncbi:MAG: HAMP domain-containing histidine kinase [Ruminococcus sp.]|nr:HAMP domain-containing histidine kinase [Ruminococcus sp.]
MFTANRSITGRWARNNLGLVIVIFFILDIVFIITLQNYYYNSVQQYMVSRLNSVSSILNRYSLDSSRNLSAEVRNTVENFSEKDRMELMAINRRGHIVITSSGFSPSTDTYMPDYETSKDEGTGYTIFTQNSGEKVMAVTYSIEPLNSEYDAVRAVVSLTEVDAQIKFLAILVTVVCLVIILMLVFSGIYFVSSIVKPIQEISLATGKFAKGDFSNRIQNDSQDEIGDLCIAINHMADELSKADEMKNEFISSVSHELRTPLTAIKGWAETLSLDHDPETMNKGIRVIVNETERLSQMVEELLDFSRMQNGRFSMQKDRMDILAELEDAILIYGEKAKRDNISLNYNAPEMLPLINGDKNRLRQVFINIIDNAIKYSNSGCTVNVEASEVDGCIQIVVEDNGCGIKASDLPRVKTKFFKANHTRRGSGIGLAVADEIITMHGGTLEVQSQENVGTTVIITLPIEQ